MSETFWLNIAMLVTIVIVLLLPLVYDWLERKP